MFGRRNKPQEPQDRMTRHVATVEQILKAAGVNVEAARLKTDSGFCWTFQRGSAVVEIYIIEHNNVGHFQVLSPIMHLPQGGLLPLYRRLLETNLQMPMASLGIYQDVVYVYSERPIAGLDASEANDIITHVARYADELDNLLVNEYGGRLYSQT